LANVPAQYLLNMELEFLAPNRTVCWGPVANGRLTTWLESDEYKKCMQNTGWKLSANDTIWETERNTDCGNVNRLKCQSARGNFMLCDGYGGHWGLKKMTT
jgi:hypothetical protein